MFSNSAYIARNFDVVDTCLAGCIEREHMRTGCTMLVDDLIESASEDFIGEMNLPEKKVKLTTTTDHSSLAYLNGEGKSALIAKYSTAAR